MGKDSSPGIFGRVARLVRGPETDNDDARPPDSQSDAGQGRQLLKELMERRRRNDFVRRREFDQLRRLRRTGQAMAPDDVDTRHSFFQPSTIDARAEVDDRAVTLRKIDEIEEQMSRQWWKTRPPNPNEIRQSAAPPRTRPPGAGHTRPPGGPDTQPSQVAAPRAAASPGVLPDVPLFDTLPPTQPASGFVSTAYNDYLDSRSGPRDHLPHAKGEPDLELPDAFIELPDMLLPVELPAVAAEPAGFTHHPLLEEASIQFANGDPDSAEKSLRALVGGAAENNEEVWAALFDLYRALGRQDRFDALSITYAERFGRSPPAWVSLVAVPESEATPVDESGDFHWRSPAALGTEAVERLRLAAASAPGAWWLDWSPLARLEDGAAEPLLAAFSAWSEQPVVLRFEHADRLVGALEGRTLSGDTDADPAWWRLRMETLRLIGRAEAFEEVALDYCITYEVSPPSWHMARCDCRVLQPGTRTLAPLALPQAAGPGWADSVVGGLPPASVLPVSAATLAGDVARNVDDVLKELDDAAAAVMSGEPFVVDCAGLVRLDFAAAGSVLNWAASQQGAGRQLQFRNLHRLAATFFNVIGIDEYALVQARAD